MEITSKSYLSTFEIFRSLGGYTMGQADNIRRAISKKKMKVIEAERKVFVYGDEDQGISGAMARGVTEAAAQSIYDEIVDFANYAFNKAHAVCYAVVSYQTAYLKCHYPKQYMAALMTSVLDNATSVAGYIAECKEMGIAVLPPHINKSEDSFTIEPEGIRFGLGAVKNVGRGLIRNMVARREEGGPFRSLEDFLQRMADGDINKRAVENFIKCGAMDCFGLKRSQMLAIFEMMMDSIADARRRNVEGQMGLFSMEADTQLPEIPVPDLPEIAPSDRMLFEKETTGLYLSGHPMDDYREKLKHTRAVTMSSLLDPESGYADDSLVTVAGIVQGVKMKTTRNNSMMAYVTVEDDTASLEMLAFSNVLQNYGSLLKENTPVLINGRLSYREDKPAQIVINRVKHIRDIGEERQAEAAPRPAPGSKLYLKLPSEDSLEYRKTRAILQMFPGSRPVVLYFADTKIRRGTTAYTEPAMLAELKTVLGAQCVVEK